MIEINQKNNSLYKKIAQGYASAGVRVGMGEEYR